jgi:hypothetical protein
LNFPFDGLNIDPDDELDDANDSAAVERVLGDQLAESRDDRPLLLLLQRPNQRLLQHGLPFQLLNTEVYSKYSVRPELEFLNNLWGLVGTE